MSDDTIDQLTGLAGVVVTAGVVKKLSDSMFGGNGDSSSTRRKRATKKSTSRRKAGPGFGDFSNLGY